MLRRPLVNIAGRLRELPVGDTVEGAGGAAGEISAWREPVSVYNNGVPEIVFSETGEVVMTDAGSVGGVLVNPDTSEIIAGILPQLDPIARGAVTTELGSFVDVVAAYNLAN